MDEDKLTAQRAATAARQRARRIRLDALGLVEVRNMWVHPDDVDTIRAYATALANVRKAACTATGADDR